MTAEEIRKQYNFMKTKVNELDALKAFAAYHLEQFYQKISIEGEYSDEYGTAPSKEALEKYLKEIK